MALLKYLITFCGVNVDGSLYALGNRSGNAPLLAGLWLALHCVHPL